jgi:hypothetical protein
MVIVYFNATFNMMALCRFENDYIDVGQEQVVQSGVVELQVRNWTQPSAQLTV